MLKNFLSNKTNIVAIQCILYTILIVTLWYKCDTILQWILLVVTIGAMNTTTYVLGMSRGMVIQAIKDDTKIIELWKLMRSTDKKDFDTPN
jgi:hypothetical protein